MRESSRDIGQVLNRVANFAGYLIACGSVIGDRQHPSRLPVSYGSLRLAGPCVEHGLDCQRFEKFMHPFGPCLDVADDDV